MIAEPGGYTYKMKKIKGIDRKLVAASAGSDRIVISAPQLRCGFDLNLRTSKAGGTGVHPPLHA